jgi:hypothetical protein
MSTTLREKSRDVDSASFSHREHLRQRRGCIVAGGGTVIE